MGVIRLRLAPRPLSAADVLAMEHQPFERDWSGGAPRASLGFVVAVDPERVWLAARCGAAPDHDAGLERGAFVAGLWRRDVAELFVAEDGTERYQEFNLAPGGAWWSGLFSSYRCEAPTFRPPRDVVVVGEPAPEGWRAALGVRRDELSVRVRWDRGPRLNVCAIVGAPDRQYFAARPVPGKPDFHLVAAFAPAAPLR